MPEKKADSLTTPRAQRYQAMKNRLFLFHMILQTVFLTLWTVTGWSRALKRVLLPLRDDFFGIIALYFAVFCLLGFLVAFPLDFFEGYVWERRFGLSREPLASWFKDMIKKSLIGFAVGLVLVEGIYFFLSEWPGVWWLAAALLWFIVSVVMARIFPSIILPLFFKATPLAPGPLRERLMELLRVHGVRLRDIFVLDFSRKTIKANAMVAGLGRSKKIYLSDTLVADFSVEEIASVLAHEIGHYLHRDTFRLVAVGFAAALVSFYGAHLALGRLVPYFGFAALSDIASLPLLLLVLLAVSFLLLPAQNAFSRALETRADRFSISATRSAEVFISMIRRLGAKNLSDFAPPRWAEFFLYTHPSISRRIRMAEAMITNTDQGDGI